MHSVHHRLHLALSPLLVTFLRHLYLPTGTILQPRRQNLTPVIRYQERVLKLCRPRPVDGHTRPIIRPCFIPGTAHTYHRLDGKTHPRLRNAHGLVFRVMRNIRRTVEQRIDTMPAIRRNDRAFLLLGVFFYRVADVAEGEAWFDGFDGKPKTFAGGFDQVDICFVQACGANVVGFVEVTVVAAVVEGDVEVDYIAIEENSGVGNTVADYFVDGGADGFWEVHVVEGRGISLETISQ